VSRPCGLNVTLAEWHLVRGSADDAWNCAEAAYTIANNTRFVIMIPAGLVMMGAAALMKPDIESARRCFDEAKGCLDSPKASPWTKAFFQLHSGRFLLADKDIAKAASQFLHAVSLGSELKSQEYVGLGLYGMAQTHQADGRYQDADESVSQAVFVRII